MIQEGNVFKNILKVTVFDPKNSSIHSLFDVLIHLFQENTCSYLLLHVQCIRQIFLFQEVLSRPSIFQEAASRFYLGYVFLWNKHFQSCLLSKELIYLTHELQPSIPWKTFILLKNTRCSHTFFQAYRAFSEWEFQQGGIIVSNLIINNDQLIMISPWLQAYTYSKISQLLDDAISIYPFFPFYCFNSTGIF